MYQKLSDGLSFIATILTIIEISISLYDRTKSKQKETHDRDNNHSNYQNKIKRFPKNGYAQKLIVYAIKILNNPLIILLLTYLIANTSPTISILTYFLVSTILTFVYIKKWAKTNFIGALLTSIFTFICNMFMSYLLNSDMINILTKVFSNGIIGSFVYILRLLIRAIFYFSISSYDEIFKIIGFFFFIAVSIRLLKRIIQSSLLTSRDIMSICITLFLITFLTSFNPLDIIQTFYRIFEFNFL